MNKMAILDNPIWSALVSDNAAFGSGTDQVRFFHSDIAPFASMESYTPENFRTLSNLVEDERTVVLFSPQPDLDPLPFDIVDVIPGYQMVFEAKLPEAVMGGDLLPLTDEEVPAMLDLTQLAQPGPFAQRTIKFGGYRGAFDEGRLVAMGGHRLKANGYTEISAVCTHPDHNGKGYARRVLNTVVRDIASEGNVAYLHVRADNTRAVELYQRMGFSIRTIMNFYVLKNTRAELRSQFEGQELPSIEVSSK